jgi:hypothetical protein
MAYPEPGYTSYGGIQTTSGSYNVHVFLNSGSLILERNNSIVTYLVVGPGGSNQNLPAAWVIGGAGAGGVLFVETQSLSANSYDVIIGTGDSVGAANGNELNTSFNGIIAYRGGNGLSSGNGGCGGGGEVQNSPFTAFNGALGTAEQGYNGGNGVKGGTIATSKAGGGGGAGGIGGNAADAATGLGGSGRSIFLSGSSQTYSVGGEGAVGTTSDGTSNISYGSGAGGVKFGTSTVSSNGKNGIVIIKVLTERNDTKVFSIENDSFLR